MRSIVNRYKGRCVACGAIVPAKGGKARLSGGVWKVIHLTCLDGSTNERLCQTVHNGELKTDRGVAQIVIGGREYSQNRNGRCEDAPCCGCCTI